MAVRTGPARPGTGGPVAGSAQNSGWLTLPPPALVRDSAYYSVVGDSALTGLKRPREFRTLGRFMVEVSLVSAPLAARAAPWAAAMDLWPNPAHARLHLRLPAGSGPATLAVLDAAGRLRRPAVPLPVGPDGAAELDLTGLAPGLYVLRVGTAAGVQHRRVAVE